LKKKTLSFKFLGFQSSTVNSISISSKKIAIGTSDGVYISDIDPIYFVNPTNISPLLTSGNFLATYFYRDNPYRVIVGKNDGSLYRIDLEKGTFEKLKIRANSIYSIYISCDGRIFVGTESALLWSDNDGQSFKGFASRVFGGDMEVDPNNPSIIYVGSDSGLLKSIDGGSSFVNVGFINGRFFYWNKSRK
jgi:ligand-binding sensor domain-containing protein